MSAKITQLSNGAEGVFIKNERFNTTLVSFNFPYLWLKIPQQSMLYCRL